MSNTEKMKQAILRLAECIDQLENVSTEVKRHKHFMSRRQLIKDILDGEA